jgi:23S rRNA pseudouridine1911/1915/1917 synthase
VSRREDAEGGTLELVVGIDADGARLDAFLGGTVPGLSRTRAQRSIEDGDVLVNGATPKSSQKVHEGDVVELELPAPPVTTLEPQPVGFGVVYEDEDLIVVEKPAGLVVHPGAGVESGTLANGLLYRFGKGVGPAWRPGIVHRIDKDTSGLLVVARTDAAHAALSGQFQARTVLKTYCALVYGRVDAAEGRLDKPIGRHPKVRVKMSVRPHGHGRDAVTLYNVRERFDAVTLLEVEIKTGRTHQIRVHMADLGHPVVGDETYGPGRAASLRDPQLRRRVEGLYRQFLHAEFLEFDHPRTGERVSFRSALPPRLADFLEYVRSTAR